MAKVSSNHRSKSLPTALSSPLAAEGLVREARTMLHEQPQLVAWVVAQWAAAEIAGKPVRKVQGSLAPLGGLDAVAVLVTTLGQAAVVLAFQQMAPNTLVELGLSMHRQAVVSRRRQYEVLRDFLDMANQHVVLVDDPLAFTQAALERAVGARRAQRVLAAIAARSATTLEELLQSLSLDVLADCVRQEPPQVAAALLGQLETSRAAALCQELDESLGRDLLARLDQDRQLTPIALRQLHEGLVRALSAPNWLGTQAGRGLLR